MPCDRRRVQESKNWLTQQHPDAVVDAAVDVIRDTELDHRHEKKAMRQEHLHPDRYCPGHPYIGCRGQPLQPRIHQHNQRGLEEEEKEPPPVPTMNPAQPVDE